MDDDQGSDSAEQSPQLHQAQNFNIVDFLSHNDPSGDHAAFAHSSRSASDGEMAESSLKSGHLRMDVDATLLTAEEEQAMLNLERLYPLVDQKKTPLPRYWSLTDKCKDLELSHDCLIVTYVGKGHGNQDAASVRSNVPIPRSCGIYYYEIQILENGNGGFLGVGICDSNVSMSRLPGWEHSSYGYHGDDGFFFESSGKGVPYGPKFGNSDTIGCGINFALRTLFFTRNGKHLGVAMRNVPIDTIFFPTIGSQTHAEKIDTNFGQRPFVYNIEEELKQTERLTLQHISAVQMPAEKSVWMAKTISSWLACAGYAKTLSAFNEATNLESKSAAVDEELNERRAIMQLVVDRRVGEAIRRVDAISPRILDGHNLSLRLLLMLQEFVDTYAAMRATASDDDDRGDERRCPSLVAAVGRSDHNFAGLSEEAATTSGVSRQRRSPLDGSIRGEAMHVDGGVNNAVITNGYSTANGFAASAARQTNGNIHSSTNGTSAPSATAATSTSIVAEQDDVHADSMSLTSDLSESSYVSDLSTKDVHIEPNDSLDDSNYSALIQYGQKISAFASRIDNLATELQRRMDDVFSIICYNTPTTSPKSYLLDPSFRAFLARTLNTAIMTVTCGERCQTPATLFRLARDARSTAIQSDVVGAHLAANKERIFQSYDEWFDLRDNGRRAT